MGLASLVATREKQLASLRRSRGKFMTSRARLAALLCACALGTLTPLALQAAPDKALEARFEPRFDSQDSEYREIGAFEGVVFADAARPRAW